MDKKEVDPKGRIVATKSGRFYKIGEQLNTAEAAAAQAFQEENIIEEDVENKEKESEK